MVHVITIPVTLFSQNARLLIDQASSKAAVVDPGGDVDLIMQAVRAHTVEVESILLTHAHLDHAGGVQPLLDRFPVQARPRFFAHRREANFRRSITAQASFFGLVPQEFSNCPEPDEYLEDGSKFQVGSSEGTVLFTPGHSPGHISVWFEQVTTSRQQAPAEGVLVGDVLFAGSIGRTDLMESNHQDLMRSINEKLLVLADSTIVMPGHGPDTTIGVERRSNPFLTTPSEL